MAPRPIVYEAPRPAAAPGETIVTSTCGHNCGGRCVVNAHVRDGRIVRISTDPRTWTPVTSVADAIAYLAAESSGHVTGTLLAI